jgi:hypothetical protein
MRPTQSRNVWRITGWLAIVLCLAITPFATAAEPRDVERQTREFRVSVDGKPRGKCTMQIRLRDDGTNTVRINSALSFNFVVYDYRYSSAGTEVWKEGRLVALENKADYNGTRYHVKANATDKGLRVAVNEKTSQVDPDVWATSYWHLPEHLVQADPADRKGVVPAAGTRPERKAAAVTVPLLDSDKGVKLRGEMKRVGEETVKVAGKKTTCTHYRIRGDVEVDLWYDADRRLARQESVDSGHKTVLELTRVAGE